MSCRGWRDRIIEASPTELGDPSGDLGAHLAACESCRDFARTILLEQAALAAVLDRAARSPAGDPDAVVRRARLLPTRGGRDRALQRGLAIAVTAAAILAVLIARPARRPPATFVPLPSAEARAVPISPLVEAPVGSRVAVLKTSRPDITVVWYF